jgi:hypothetical protein
MFQPTPRQSLTAMRGAAATYERRIRKQQQTHYWHLKSTPGLVRALRQPFLIQRPSYEHEANRSQFEQS